MNHLLISGGGKGLSCLYRSPGFIADAAHKCNNLGLEWCELHHNNPFGVITLARR